MRRRRSAVGRWRRFYVAAAICIGTSASGETWHVALDGGGDYAVIQDAVDAAAAGDTINIGHGRYDDFEIVHAPGWAEPTIVLINKDDLTLIGSGVGETRIGPETFFGGPGVVPKSICCIESYSCTIQRLTVENCRDGIYWGAGRLELQECEILDYEMGLGTFAEGGLLVNETNFRSIRGTSYAITAYPPSRDLLVVDCQFSGSGRGAYFTGSLNVHITDCWFSCAGGNIRYTNSIGLVERCTVAEGAAQGVIVASNSEVQITDSVINGHTIALQVHSGSIVNSSGCVFSGGTNDATIDIYSTSQVNLHGCDILNGGNYSVKVEYFFNQFIEQDMAGNYWGTTDTAQIDAWIWDGHDDAAIHSVVNYLPIADGPVPVESHTWTEVKGMFRPSGR